MEKREFWQEIYNRFAPEEPAKGERRAERQYSPTEAIVDELGMPFGDPRILLTGTIGTGKTTELLRIAELRSEDDLVVFVDLVRHFNDVVEDMEALQRISAWEVVFLAALSIVRVANEVLDGDVSQKHLEQLHAAWFRLAQVGQVPNPPEEIDILELGKGMILLGSGNPVGGALKLFDAVKDAGPWTLPLGTHERALSDQQREVGEVLDAANAIIGAVQSGHRRRILLIIDGLDRIRSFDHTRRLLIESELIGRLACPTILCAPMALHHHLATSNVRRFDNHPLANVPVLDQAAPAEHGPGISFMCALYAQRVSDLDKRYGVPEELLVRLAYYSGGRARDFVKLIRDLAGRCWRADIGYADSPRIDEAIDTLRRSLESGLDAGHLELLQGVIDDPKHRLPADERARELLTQCRLLPYPNESEWYFPHPLLTKSLLTLPAG